MPSSSSSDRDRLVFGCAALGMAYGLPRASASAAEEINEADVQRLVDLAIELGVGTFDTAPAYGASEQRVGRALGPARGKIWTKVTSGDPAASLAASLDRIGRPCVDLLQWHNWTAGLASDRTWTDAWRALRSDDRVVELGATTYGPTDALAALSSGLFDVVQVEYNLLNQRVVDVLAAAPHAGSVRIAVRSIYLQGALTDEGRALPDRATLRQGVDDARRVAGSLGLTHLALRTALEHPAISHVIVGFDRPPQIADAVDIANAPPLSAETKAATAKLDLHGDPATDPRSWR